MINTLNNIYENIVCAKPAAPELSKIADDFYFRNGKKALNDLEVPAFIRRQFVRPEQVSASGHRAFSADINSLVKRLFVKWEGNFELAG